MENKNQEQPELEKRKKFSDYKGIFWLIASCLIIVALIFYYRDIVKTINYYIGYLASIVYGVFIAFMLNPIMKYFEAKLLKHYKKSKKEKVKARAEIKSQRWSIAISVTIGLLAVSLLILLIVPEVLNSVIKLSNDAPGMIDSVMNKINNWNTDRTWAGSFEKYIDQVLDALQTWLTGTLLPSASAAFTSITSAAWDVIMFIFNFTIGFIIAVYLLKDKKLFIAWGKKLAFAFMKPERANLVLETARYGNRIIGRYLLGSVLDSFLVGILCFLFNFIAGMPYPLLISAIVGLTNVIPFFGPFLGAIPSAFIILIVDPAKCVLFIIFIFILQQVEGNIIAPQILGNTTGVSEFGVTFALLFFGAMFGVMGMLIGIPLIAVIFYVIQKLTNKHMEKKNIPSDTDFYEEVFEYDNENKVFTMIDHERFEKEQHEKVKPRNEKVANAFNRFKCFIKRKEKNLHKPSDDDNNNGTKID